MFDTHRGIGEEATDAGADDHRGWLDGLALSDRVEYCRAFGRAWSAGRSQEECQRLAREAVLCKTGS